MKNITRFILTGAIASGLVTTPNLLAEDEKPAQATEAEPDAKGYLGVGFGQVPDALRSHLDIDDGVGLLVQHLDPDGPALTAGLADHDIVVGLDDQIITSADQLVTLVRNREPGSTASLKIYRKGTEMDIPVTVGSAPARVASATGRPQGIFQLQGTPFSFRSGGVNQDDIFTGIQEQLKAQGIDLDNRMGANGIDLQKFLGQQLGINITALGGGQPNNSSPAVQIVNSNASSINIIDDEHSISLTGNDGDFKLVAKDAEGTVLYDGPYNTDEDKAKVSEPVREKLKNARGMVEIGEKKAKKKSEDAEKNGTEFVDEI